MARINCSVCEVRNNIRKLVFHRGVSYSSRLTSLWKHWLSSIILHKHQLTLTRLVHAMRSNGPLPQVSTRSTCSITPAWLCPHLGHHSVWTALPLCLWWIKNSGWMVPMEVYLVGQKCGDHLADMKSALCYPWSLLGDKGAALMAQRDLPQEFEKTVHGFVEVHFEA